MSFFFMSYFRSRGRLPGTRRESFSSQPLFAVFILHKRDIVIAVWPPTTMPVCGGGGGGGGGE